MSEHHAEDEHAAEQNRFSGLVSLGDISERYRDGGQGYGVEAEQESCEEADADRSEIRLLERSLQYLDVHRAAANP
jgi:hypothetical protein